MCAEASKRMFSPKISIGRYLKIAKPKDMNSAVIINSFIFFFIFWGRE